MNQKLLEILQPITPEEEAILNGSPTIDRTLYYHPDKKSSREIDSAQVLKNGKLIDLRPHVRFVHFPAHTHNFVEFIYMCQGSTTHQVDGQKIVLAEGDLLFLNQHATQEILPAGEKDIAVNFMILPQFFDTAFRMLGREDSALRDFLISCLTDVNKGGNYLYFQVAEILPIQNLIENLIWTMLGNEPNRRTLAQNTMGLLFLNLVNHTDCLRFPGQSYEEDLMIRLLRYIDTEYKSASLSFFAGENKREISQLSRLISRTTGHSFSQLLQEKRLSQACFLLKNTSLSVDDISAAVGYENTSFFHRLFLREMGISPRRYRQQERG